MTVDQTPKETSVKRYHHGDLRGALLKAGEVVLERDGLEKLTLRAIAREVGVSHAAPKNHFPTLAALLSELAIVGFDRLASTMAQGMEDAAEGRAKRIASGQGYIKFARDNPALFKLLFSGEKHDFSNERLAASAQGAFSKLSNSTNVAPAGKFTADEAAFMAARWSMVHGYAMLMIDGRLDKIIENVGEGVSEEELSALIFNHASAKP